ncbi:MAG: HprK-related kinase B [Arenicellales bacterium]
MTEAIHDLQSAVSGLTGTIEPGAEPLTLGLGECTLRLRSNSKELIDTLRQYFSHVVVQTVASPNLEVIAIERDSPELGIKFIDWKREPGKVGRKDAYYDLPQARLVKKVRTGMVFLQSDSLCIAAGPCVNCDNQVINFINAQYMNWLQQRDWLICHASGLVFNGRTLGIAGFSGGGKSTLMLHMLDDKRVSYLTNDRLFISRQNGRIDAAGIPKLPRINPGTIVHNPTLHPLISQLEREQLLKLPAEELWYLEDKYDVHIDQIYGVGRIVPEAPLNAFLVLNWKRDSDAALAVERVDLAVRRDLLGAIMKSPGPFYQYSDGNFFQDTTELEPLSYLDVLKDIPVYEASGGVDFAALTQICFQELMN